MKKNTSVYIVAALIIFSIIFSPFLIHFLITFKSCIGFINQSTQEVWINYYGAIISGALTLVGVWWTIKSQEKKRNEDLAIQYRPVVYFSIKDDFSKEFSRVCIVNKKKYDDIDIDKLEQNDIYKFNKQIHILNAGRGNALVQYDINCNIDNSRIKSLIDLTPKVHFLYVNQPHIFEVCLHKNLSIETGKDFQIQYTVKYCDEFKFNQYSVDVTQTYKVEENGISLINTVTENSDKEKTDYSWK